MTIVCSKKVVVLRGVHFSHVSIVSTTDANAPSSPAACPRPIQSRAGIDRTTKQMDSPEGQEVNLASSVGGLMSVGNESQIRA